MKILDTPFDNLFLDKLPLAYKYMTKRETETIGELYNKVKFSQSKKHRSIMMNNYVDFKPISNLCLDKKYQNNISKYEK